jgi:hypothetical protein
MSLSASSHGTKDVLFFLAAYLDSGLQKLEELQQPRSNLKKKLRPTSNPLWNEEFLPDPKWNWVQQL